MDTSILTSWGEGSSACSFSSLNCVGIFINCEKCVVVAIPTWKLAMGILGVNVLRSWWYPHCQMFRDFWESTGSTPSGILIFKWRGVSKRPRVVLLVVSWFQNLLIRGILLFQTTTTS